MIITKRNGTIHVFDEEKIAKSILHANAEVSLETITPAIATSLAEEVFARATKEHEVITTADVRDYVFDLLNEKGFPGTAVCYMEYKKRK